MGLAFLQILLLDIGFLALCVLVVSPLVVYKRAAFAVLKRNFIGYFSNPTGYVFLCIFVLLTSFAAFWPHEFFTANLANLDQLNKVLPLIMLVFIPAITMSIWSEERRQGTDELLLTLPADDFDIVIGKYLAAASIFTASLLFSQFSNYMVLASLSQGDLDTGLFFTTYLGYWMVGLAMLAIGMVASFLTSNMTVGFILGAAFNAPLAFAASADLIVPVPRIAELVRFWSLDANFDDFGRGVVTLSSFAYFALVIVIGMYLSMVLIGTRHWGGKGGPWQFLHYVLRAAALVAGLLAICLFLNDYDRVRYDTTADKVNSLSPKTRQLLRDMQPEHPIIIDAFISSNTPDVYVKTRFELVSLLKEFDVISGQKIDVRLHENLEPFSDEATLARDRFGIQPTQVRTHSRGAYKDEEVILGAAFSCGLEKVVVPFFDHGIPVEYELIRSIGTVSQGKRKTIGIVRTDAQLFGGFSFAGGMPQQLPKFAIVEELEKQYDVEEVDPTNPIDENKYDALLIVQPSSLGPMELPNVVAAVKSGIPSAIFEDPMPIFLRSAPGTGEPKQSPGGMFGGGGPQPKGNITELWKALGIQPPGEPGPLGFNPDIAWQKYNPYLVLQIDEIPDAWVFASTEVPDSIDTLNPEDPITQGLNEILLPVPGVIAAAPTSDLKLVPLVKTGEFAGTMRVEQFQQFQANPEELETAQGLPKGAQILVARIQSVGETPAEPNADKDAAAEKKTEDSKADKKEEGAARESPAAEAAQSKPINVVYVADIDLLFDAFVRLRARPDEEGGINWRFENVNFILNMVDALSGDNDYVEIRRRKPYHTTLKKIEELARLQQQKDYDERQEYKKKRKEEDEKLQDEEEKLEKERTKQLEELQKRQREGGDVKASEVQALRQLDLLNQQKLETTRAVRKEQLDRDLREKNLETQRQTELKILDIQNYYKLLAVILPPIPPLLVGLVVFVTRRLREREGIARSRLRL